MATQVHIPEPVSESNRELIEDFDNSTNTILQEEKTLADTPKGPSTDEGDAFLKTTSADGVHPEVNYVSLHANMATEKPNQRVNDETEILLVRDSTLGDQPLDTAAKEGTCSERIQENTQESNELWIGRDKQLENESKTLLPTEASTKLEANDKAKDADQELVRVELFENEKNRISLRKQETDEYMMESLHVVPDNLKASNLSPDKEKTSSEEQTENMSLHGITSGITEEKTIEAVETQKDVLESLPMIVSCSPKKGNTDAVLQGNTRYGTVSTTIDMVGIEKEVLEVQNFSITSLNEGAKEKHFNEVDVSEAKIEEFLEKESEKVKAPQPLAREATDDESVTNHEAVIVDGELQKYETGENEKCTEADLQEEDSKIKKPEDSLNADSTEIEESYLGHIKETSSFVEQSETKHPRVISDKETDEKYMDAAERNENFLQVQDDHIFASNLTVIQNQSSEDKNEENSEQQSNKPSSIKDSVNEIETISSEEQSEIASSQIIQDQKTKDEITDPDEIKEETLVVENVPTLVSNEKMEENSLIQVDATQKKNEKHLEKNEKPSFSKDYLKNANDNALTATDEVKYDYLNEAEQLEVKSKQSDMLKKELQMGKPAESFPAVMEDTKPTDLGQEIERTDFPEDQCPTVNPRRILDEKTEKETADPCDTEDKTQVQQIAVISVSNEDSERNSLIQYEGSDKNSSIQLDASDMKPNIDLVKQMQEPSPIEASIKDNNEGASTVTHEVHLVDEHTKEVGLSDGDKTTDSTFVMKENLHGAPEDHKPSPSSEEIGTISSLDELCINANIQSVINEKGNDKIDTTEEKLENVVTKVPQEHTEEILVIQLDGSQKERDEHLGKESKTSFPTEALNEENNTVSESKDRNEDSIEVESWEKEKDTNTSMNEGRVEKHTDFDGAARDDIQASDSTQDTKISQAEEIQPPHVQEMPSGKNEEMDNDANDKETLDFQDIVKNNLVGDTENESLIKEDGTQKEVSTVKANDYVSPDKHDKNEEALVTELIPIVSPETVEASALVKVEQVPPSDPQKSSSQKSVEKFISGYHEQEEIDENAATKIPQEHTEEILVIQRGGSQKEHGEHLGMESKNSFLTETLTKENKTVSESKERNEDSIKGESWEKETDTNTSVNEGWVEKHTDFNEGAHDDIQTSDSIQDTETSQVREEIQPPDVQGMPSGRNEETASDANDKENLDFQDILKNNLDGDTERNEDILPEQEDQKFALTEKIDDNPLIQNQNSENKNEEYARKTSSIKDLVHEVETISSEEQSETVSSRMIQDQKTNNKSIDPAEIKEEALVVKDRNVNVPTTVSNVKTEENSSTQLDGPQKKNEDHLEDNVKLSFLKDSLANAGDNALAASDMVKLDDVNGTEVLEEKSKEIDMLKQELHIGEPAESFLAVKEDTKPTDLGQDIEKTDFPEDQYTIVASRRILCEKTEKKTADPCDTDDKTQVQQNSEISLSNEASERSSLIQYEDSDKNSSVQLDASDMKHGIDLVKEMEERSQIEPSTNDIEEGESIILHKAAVVDEQSRDVGLSDGDKTTDSTLMMKENRQDAPDYHKSPASTEGIEKTCPLYEKSITANPQLVIHEKRSDAINKNDEKLGNVETKIPQEHTEEILVIQPGGSQKEHDEHLRKESRTSFPTEALTDANNTVSESKDRNEDSIKVESWEKERDANTSVNEEQVEKHTDFYEVVQDDIQASDSTEDTKISHGREEIQNPVVQEMSSDRNEETASDANDTITVDFRDIVKNNLDEDYGIDSLIKKDGTQKEVSAVKANDNVAPDTHEKSEGALIKEVIPSQAEIDDKAFALVKEKQVLPADPQEISFSKSEDKIVGGSHKQDEVVEDIEKKFAGGENEDNSPVKVDGLHEPSSDDASTGARNDIDPPILSNIEGENSIKANLTENERCAEGILATETSEESDIISTEVRSKITDSQEMTSQHNENKNIDATELEEGTLENQNIKTTTPCEEALGNSLLQMDCSQIEETAQLENGRLKPSSIEAQKANTTENALWKNESEIEKRMDFVQVPSEIIEAPSSSQDTETSFIEQQDMTLNPQEIPDGKTKERSEDGTNTKGKIQEDIASSGLNGEKENATKVDGSQNPLLTEASPEVFEIQDIETNVPEGDNEESVPAKPDESEKPSAEALTGNINEVQDIEENRPSGDSQDLSPTKVDGSQEPYLADDLTGNAAHHEPALVDESSLKAVVLSQVTAEEIGASASGQDREPTSQAEQSLVEKLPNMRDNDREIEITCATDLKEDTANEIVSESVAAEIPCAQVSDVNTNMVVDFSEGLNCKQEESVRLNASEGYDPISNELVANVTSSTSEPSEQDSVTTDAPKKTVEKDGPTKISENEGTVERDLNRSSSTCAQVPDKENKAEKKEEDNLNGEDYSSNPVTLVEVPSSNVESEKDLAPKPSLKPIKETWHEAVSETAQEQDEELHFLARSAVIQDSSSKKIGHGGDLCPTNVTDSLIPQEMQKLEEKHLPATDRKQTENEDWQESETKRSNPLEKMKNNSQEKEEADINDEKALLDDTILETKVPELASVSVENDSFSKLIVSTEIDRTIAERQLETNKEGVQAGQTPTGDYKETEFEKDKQEEASEQKISDFSSAALNIIDSGDFDGANHSTSGAEAPKVIQTAIGANENLEAENMSIAQTSASISSCEIDNYEHPRTAVEEEPDTNEVGFAPEESNTKHGVKNQVLETIEQVQSVKAVATEIVFESAMVEDICAPKEIMENVSSQKIKDEDKDVQDDHLGSRKADNTDRHLEDQVTTVPEGAINKLLEDPEEIQEIHAKHEVSPVYSADKSEKDATRVETWSTPKESEHKNSYVEAEKVRFSSLTEDAPVFSNSDAAEDIQEENKNSTTKNTEEKCANEEQTVAELTRYLQPNVSGEGHAAAASWKGPVSETQKLDEQQQERTFEPSTKTRDLSSQEKKMADYDSENFSESNVHQNSIVDTAQSDENQEIVMTMTSPPTLPAVKCSNIEIAAKDLAMGFEGTSVTELKVPTVGEEASDKVVECLGEIYVNDEINPMHSTIRDEEEEMRAETWAKPTEDEDKNTKVEMEKVGFSSHTEDTTEVSNSDAAQEVPKYNESFTTTNKYYQQNEGYKPTEKCANEETTGTVFTGSLEAKGSSDGQEAEANRKEDPVSETLQHEIDEPDQQDISDKPMVLGADNTRNTNPENSDTAVEHENIGECSLDEHELLKKSATSELEEKARHQTANINEICKAKDIEEPSQLDLLQDYPKETSQTAYQSTHEKEPARHNEVLRAEKGDEVEHEERKTDGEKDEEQEEEESNEPGNAEVHSEAPVMVDAGDAEVKVGHKKSHNILSGVGSKVKHSIAKVKKAITGKSTHPKPPSPK